MRPSHLKPGTWLVIREAFGTGEYHARFEGRTPAQGKGRPAVNHLFNPESVEWDFAHCRGKGGSTR